MKLRGTSLKIQFLHHEAKGIWPSHKCVALTIQTGSKYPPVDRSACLICRTVLRDLPKAYDKGLELDEVGSRGTTTCVITDEAHNCIAAGTAYCQPPDRYDRERGRKEAFTKALRHANLARDYRSVLWEAYHRTQEVEREHAEKQRQEAKAKKQ